MGTRKLSDPAILQQMLEDYISSGLSYVALGRKYGCDHTSIMFQVNKHKVERGVPQQRTYLEKPVTPKEPPISRLTAFSNPETLKQMIEDYKMSGRSTFYIADKYGCSHQAILQ